MKASLSAVARKLVWDRAKGSCERCGTAIVVAQRDYSFHHRRRRTAARRPTSHLPSNLLLLCGSDSTGCCYWVDANRTWAGLSGYVLGEHADPSSVPVLVGGARWVLLTTAGRYVDTAPPKEAV